MILAKHNFKVQLRQLKLPQKQEESSEKIHVLKKFFLEQNTIRTDEK